MRAVHLRCEYLENPIGIDVTRPRFYWQAEGGERQTAYQIVCRRDGEVVWDSGKVVSSSMTHIRYEGKPLRSRNIVTWQVRLWDEKDAGASSDQSTAGNTATAGMPDGISVTKTGGSAVTCSTGDDGAWSEPASFELGLLFPENWSAQWIRGDVKDKKNQRFPVDCFRKDFEVCGEVKTARLYITACGLYEAKINGKLASDFCLAPGSTDYRKRIQYQTYDVTELLRGRKEKKSGSGAADSGKHMSANSAAEGAMNNLTVELADGWYRGSVGAMGLTHAYGRMTKLLFQLEIRYEDGSTQTVVSDGSVRWSNDGPIRFADLKDGEIVDGRRQPSYSGKARVLAGKEVPAVFDNVTEREKKTSGAADNAGTQKKAVVCASDNVFPRKKEHFQAKLIITPSGKKVLDFGQNIAGFVAFSVKGQEGQMLRLRMGEMLDENGEFTQKNIQLQVPDEEIGKFRELFVIAGASAKVSKKLHASPEQKIDFICSGGEDHYCTKFAVFGFRYAEVKAEFPIDPAKFEAIAVYSDMEETGVFSCSNEKVNQLVHNTQWSMKSNFLDVPTDCPTRERLGWTGDAQVFFNTGAYLMDTAAFFRKWLRDVGDSQNNKGQIPAVLPYSRADMMYNVSGNSVGWADAIVLIPCRYYQMYGDVQLLADCYPMMRRYAEFMIKNTGHKKASEAKKDPNNKYVYEKGFHLGEWLEPEEFQEKIGTDTAGAATKMLHTEECTAYLHYTMAHMAEAAKVLGYHADAARYQEYADGAAKAYDALFLNPVPDTDRQAKLVRPLALGVVPEVKKKAVADRLVKAVENREYCVGTGFLSTPFVLPVLTESGHSDDAYKMLECEKYPSWLSEVNTGATTIWESWEGEVSRNHYSPGAVCEWLFNSTLGIRVDGENHFRIKPVPGGTLSHAEGEYRSLYGTVKSSWKKTENGYEYHVEVPANTTAEVVLPDGQSRTVTAGRWDF